jgi:hypothetical protein
MAAPQTAKFGAFRVLLGDGNSPEVFSAPCGFTQKAYARSKELSESNVPDCDDPDAPAWVEREVRSLSSSISGSGVLAKSALPIWDEAFDSTDSINCKIEMHWGASGAGNIITYTQKFHLSSLEISADLGEKVQISVSMESDGAAVKTVSV